MYYNVLQPIFVCFIFTLSILQNVNLTVLLASFAYIIFLIGNFQEVYLRLLFSSIFILFGSIAIGEHYAINNNDWEFNAFYIIPVLGIALDIIHVEHQLIYYQNKKDKWLFPIKMFLEKYIMILVVYIFCIILLSYLYFYQEKTDLNNALFSFILGLLCVKIILLIYGRFTKTELIDDHVEWCCKRRQYERTNFDRLDEDVNTNELYIGSAINSPILKEIYDVILLITIGVFIGINGEEGLSDIIAVFLLYCICIGKSKI